MLLLTADNIDPKIVSTIPFAHNTVLGKGFVSHGNSALDGVGSRVEVVHGNAHGTARKGDIGDRVDDFGLTGNIQFFVAKYAANKVRSCVAALAVQ